VISEAIALALSAVFSGNHISIVAGALLGAGLVRRRHVLIVAVVGYVVGFLMGRPLYEYARSFEVDSTEVLAVALSTYVLGEVLGYPVPLSFVLTSSLLSEGERFGEGIRVLSFWALTPLISMALAVAIYELVRRVGGVRFRRAISYVLPLLTAVVLGANNLAVIAGVGGAGVFETALACLVGSIVFGVGPTANIGYRIYGISQVSAVAVQLTTILVMTIATLLSIPMSGTVSAIYGMIALSFRKGVRMFSPKVVKRVNVGFVVSALAPVIIFTVKRTLSSIL